MIFNIFKKKNKTENDTNKRNSPRKEFFQSTYCKRSCGENDDTVISCFMNNISAGGICFELTESELEEGDIVGILYKIGNSLMNDEIQIKYSKKRLNVYRFGCQFIDNDDRRTKIISNYIKSN